MAEKTSKSAIFATLTGPWPWPWARMTWKSYRWKWLVDLYHYHILVCGYIEFDCGRTHAAGRRMDGHLFTNSMSHLCWGAEMTKKHGLISQQHSGPKSFIFADFRWNLQISRCTPHSTPWYKSKDLAPSGCADWWLVGCADWWLVSPFRCHA